MICNLIKKSVAGFGCFMLFWSGQMNSNISENSAKIENVINIYLEIFLGRKKKKMKQDERGGGRSVKVEKLEIGGCRRCTCK